MAAGRPGAGAPCPTCRSPPAAEISRGSAAGGGGPPGARGHGATHLMASRPTRGPLQAIASSPTMVGAITTLIVIVAVFLAYNANSGLPFVPVYRVSVEVPNAARLTNNNEVRIGGHRVGIVESIEAIRPQTGESPTAEESGVASTTDTDPREAIARL